MNILIVNGGSDLYGASRILLYVIELLRPRKIILLLPKEGLLTEFIKTQSEFSHVQIIIEPSIPVIYRKMGISEAIRMIIKMISFRKLVKKINNEHHIAWAYVNTLSCLVVIKVFKSLGIKTLLHVHEILENDRTITRLINKFGIRWADKIIAVSEVVKLNLFEACEEKEKNKIKAILNGIPDKFKPVNPNKVNGNKIKTVTLFGRIKPEKGIWLFLDAISLLPADLIKNANFIIMGGPAPGGEHFLEKLRKDIDRHSARDHIKFYSFSPDISEILNISDIIVVPSLMKDPFPTTILEGLSAGKPVIATDTGGSVQSVKNNVTGFLIEPADKAGFSNRIKQLIESDELRKEMGKQARKEYLNNFTLDIFKRNIMREIESFEKRKKTQINF